MDGSDGSGYSDSQTVNTYPKAQDNEWCHASDGRNFCDCQMKWGTYGIEACMFYGRHTEPLAFSLDKESAVGQVQCYLFTITPREIRDMIYGYAFTDCTSHPPDRNNKFRRWRIMKEKPRPSDIAFPFLQTCKSVYLETYRLPLLLNPVIVYDFGAPTRPPLGRLAPWQFALIQSVDISLDHMALESDGLAEYMEKWMAGQRHKGAYVAPRFFRYDLDQSFNFSLIGADATSSETLKDGDKVTLVNKLPKFYDKNRSSLPFNSTARATVARPIIHLTLRLTRIDWWAWAENQTPLTQRSIYVSTHHPDTV